MPVKCYKNHVPNVFFDSFIDNKMSPILILPLQPFPMWPSSASLQFSGALFYSKILLFILSNVLVPQAYSKMPYTFATLLYILDPMCVITSMALSRPCISNFW